MKSRRKATHRLAFDTSPKAEKYDDMIAPTDTLLNHLELEKNAKVDRAHLAHFQTAGIGLVVDGLMSWRPKKGRCGTAEWQPDLAAAVRAMSLAFFLAS
jgi:hypothetical protein